MDRSQKIIRTSILGIVINLILVAFKGAVGLLSHSIAVLLDAVNNLSDALSSLITILGTKLANKAPDKKHPYGYGRIEYLTGMLIAVIVLFAGLSAAKESVEKILHPEAASYTWVSILIITVGIAAKFLTGRYVKGVGEALHSSALVASGSDAYFDSILSTGTLIGALLNLFLGLNLEGWIGAVISLIILKAGIEMLLETLGSITGERADSELTEEIKAAVTARPEVHGAYDLTLHNYGPTNTRRGADRRRVCQRQRQPSPCRHAQTARGDRFAPPGDPADARLLRRRGGKARHVRSDRGLCRRRQGGLRGGLCRARDPLAGLSGRYRARQRFLGLSRCCQIKNLFPPLLQRGAFFSIIRSIRPVTRRKQLWQTSM